MIHKYKVITLVIVLLIALGLAQYLKMPLAGTGVENPIPLTNWNKMDLGGRVINIDVVSGIADREKGLSGREKSTFPDDRGLLFVFDNIGLHSFWMKDMNFPIDIIWLDKNLRVVYIKENALPSSYPESFTPTLPALYVLEVNTGFASTTQIKIGDQAKIVK